MDKETTGSSWLTDSSFLAPRSTPLRNCKAEAAIAAPSSVTTGLTSGLDEESSLTTAVAPKANLPKEAFSSYKVLCKHDAAL